MDRISSFLRFTAPAVIFLAFVISANPQKIWCWLLQNVFINNSSISLVAEVIVGAVGAIIVLGFVISSLAYCIVNICGLRTRGASSFKGMSYCEYWQKRKQWDDGKYKIWEAHTAKNGEEKNIGRQIGNRWNMTMANLNSLIAILLGEIFVLVWGMELSSQPNFKLLIFWLILLVILFYNTWVGYRSITRINQLLTANSLNRS